MQRRLRSMKCLAALILLVGACFCNLEEGKLFGGDMELTPDQIAAVMEQNAKGSAFAAVNSNLWKTYGRPDVIKYYIEPYISAATSVIESAIRDYEANVPCLKFQKLAERPNAPHLYFTYGRGCSSPVGKRSYGNPIRLARGCWQKGTVIHEIAHSLGFFHEQSRPDRDNYVQILYQNIVPGKEHNFNKMRSDYSDSLNEPYDYHSVMHYGASFFQRSKGLITIKTKDPKMQNVIGNRLGFSKGDIVQLNKLYCAPLVCEDTNKTCPGWLIYCDTDNYVKEHCLKTCKRC